MDNWRDSMTEQQVADDLLLVRPPDEFDRAVAAMDLYTAELAETFARIERVADELVGRLEVRR